MLSDIFKVLFKVTGPQSENTEVADVGDPLAGQLDPPWLPRPF